jgi:hypothetical protein
MISCEHFLSYLGNFFCEWEMFLTNFADRFKRNIILCSVTFCKQNVCVALDNVEECCRAWEVTDDNTTQCMRIVCWIPKATGSPSEYVPTIALTLQQWLCWHPTVFCYKYISCLVLNYSSGCDNLFASSVFCLGHTLATGLIRWSLVCMLKYRAEQWTFGML